MRRVVTQFLLLRFAGFFLFVLFALTSLLVLFDVLAHADDLSVHHQNTLWPMVYYAGLRLPVLLTMITPMSVLLAALITFERLATQFELVALQSAGISVYQICLVLLLGGAGVSALHYGVEKFFATSAEVRLLRWAERDYAGVPNREVLEPGPAWFATERYRVKIANAHDRGRQLDDAIIIENPKPGLISAYIEARQARFENGRWTLYDGWEQSTGGGARTVFKERVLDLALVPSQVALVRLPLSVLPPPILRTLRDQPLDPNIPAYRYETWIAHSEAAPLAALAMILLSAPLGLQLKRSGHQLRWGGLGLGAGFLFFISERILLALAESGTVQPGLAVWSPLAFFSVTGIVTLCLLQK